MATSNPPPGAFVLEVARTGEDVVRSFMKFITTRKIQERRMESILATISITTSMLADLGNLINQYSTDVYIEDDVTRPTCQTCKADFETLLLISNEAGEKGIWLREGTLGGKPVSAEIDPYFLFNVGLGGQVKSAEFFQRLDSTRYSLVALTDTIKYKIFKVLKEQDRLSPEQTEEFKSLTALLPQLVKSIERAERLKVERLALEAEKAEKALKSSRNRPDVGHKNDTSLEKNDSDAASEVTMIEPMHDDLKKKKVQFAEDRGRSSMDSFDSIDDERNSVDTKEVLEEWLLRFADPKKDIRQSIRFLGFKLKRYDEDPGFWGIDPEFRSQAELQNDLTDLTSNLSPAKYKASVDKAMRALPLNARDVVEGLVEDRFRSTSRFNVKRQWTVVAVRSKTKYNFGDEPKWFKSPKDRDWLIMLKGETVDRTERQAPHRHSNPWAKPYYPPRSRRRPHSRVIEDDYYDRDYQRRPPRPISPMPMPMLVEDQRHRPLTRDAVIDGFRPGTIVVGEVANHEEAKKKMDDIITDLPNKFTA